MENWGGFVRLISRKVWWSAGAVMLNTLACRPVITIGWAEIVIIGGLILLLLAPFIIKVLRLFARIEKDEDQA